ncbi:MAG: alpha/beta hydrolase [Candidatus Brocadiia bacterium]
MRFHKCIRLCVIVCAALIQICGCVPLYFYQDKAIFPRDMAPQSLGWPLDNDAVILQRDIEPRGKVVAWFFPAASARPTSPAPVVIYFHGNAEVISQCGRVVREYQARGCSVLLPEYRGYGGCAGEPSQKAIVEDAVFFYDEIVKRADVDKARIVVQGRSLGGGVAAQLASRRKPAALILESSFTSLAVMAHKFLMPEFMVKHPFRTDRVLAELDVPVLIFHGVRDDVVPVEHGRKLHEIARRSVYVEYDCGHNDFPGAGNEANYEAEITNFLAQAGIINGNEAPSANRNRDVD